MQSYKIQREVILQFNEEKKLYELTKRIFDVVFSLIGLIFAMPIGIIVCIFVFIETPGNPIFKQKRCGKNGQSFTLYKIRSMRLDAEKNGAVWAAKNDSRVTKVGSFIRKTRIDEIPQLFNIIKGDMSIVGPRPERLVFYKEFEKTIPGFSKRLAVIPGLTGHAQVNGGYDLGPREKLKYDMEYIGKRDIIMDFKIIIKTAKIVFTGEGAR